MMEKMIRSGSHDKFVIPMGAENMVLGQEREAKAGDENMDLEGTTEEETGSACILVAGEAIRKERECQREEKQSMRRRKVMVLRTE